MLDLIPAQQPIKNQHQLLWCGYQHVITSKPITTLVFMRRPAFFCFRCECSGTDKTRRKRRAFLVARFFCCGNSAADISKPHTLKWGTLADVCRANSFKRFAARPECVGSIHNAHRIHSGRVANLLKLLAPKHSQRAPRSHSQRAPNTLGARCEFSHNIRGALRIF